MGVTKKDLLKYFIEFVVIVAGITVSFWLDNLSDGWAKEKERKEIYVDVQNQVEDLSRYIEGYIRGAKTRIDHLADVLDNWETFDYYDAYVVNGSKFPSGAIMEGKSLKRAFLFTSIGFYPPTETFDNLKQEGKMKVLSIEVLKSINKLNGISAYILSNNRSSRMYRDRMWDIIVDEYSFHFTDENQSYVLDVLNDIRSDLRMKMILTSRNSHLQFEREHSNRYLKELENLKTLVGKELSEME